MSTLTNRILIVAAIAAVLLIAWFILRAVGPTYGSDQENIVWSIHVTPEQPVVGQPITVTISAGGVQSPFMFPSVQVQQSAGAPAVGLVTVEGGWGVTITLDALAQGTATLTATGFFEKQACPTPGSGFCFPEGFYLTTPDIVIDVSPAGCGDANGDGVVNSIDATWTLQYAAGLIHTLVAPTNLDVNGDGNIDALDAAIMLQHAAGLVPAPTCT